MVKFSTPSNEEFRISTCPVLAGNVALRSVEITLRLEQYWMMKNRRVRWTNMSCSLTWPDHWVNHRRGRCLLVMGVAIRSVCSLQFYWDRGKWKRPIRLLILWSETVVVFSSLGDIYIKLKLNFTLLFSKFFFQHQFCNIDPHYLYLHDGRF